jgi:hypothetical protein|tara:strand:- start:401 stop:664 length:264 start_codon:yes stop_codon:yes gene_type:complete
MTVRMEKVKSTPSYFGKHCILPDNHGIIITASEGRYGRYQRYRIDISPYQVSRSFISKFDIISLYPKLRKSLICDAKQVAVPLFDYG